ncbi:MAG TPA: periplasmic heavy metal sensor [Candidatus Aminicenantes bacterium]|nr:periplasmic heavy metal sensor [Candidatus Aminicenantes bacterium]
MTRWRVLVALLLASLAVNVALTLAFFHHRRPSRPPPPPVIDRPVEIPADLDIRADQRQALQEMIRRYRVDSLPLREDIMERRVAIIEELGRPDYDPAAVRTMVGELNALEKTLNERLIDLLLQVGEVLDSRQRLHLLYRLSRDWFHLDAHVNQGGKHE